ncbi:MAG: DUF429 domain-containing protein [Thermorudis peleae]|nr:DUF429 domain-containing protein [Thermorudis peleae]
MTYAHQLTRFVGIDFSGARDAGRHCWICIAEATGASLHVQACWPALALPDSSIAREQALAALARWIARQGPCLIGCDFPFSLPRAALNMPDYVEFCRTFPDRFTTPAMLRAACTANGREFRRITDRIARAPFAPGNLRLYRQTYYGIRLILAPLVLSGAACVLPFQPQYPGKPWLIEVCPAITLRQLGIRARGYKGAGGDAQEQRARIQAELTAYGICIPQSVADKMLADRHGDALDSVVAAITAWCVRDHLTPPDAAVAAEGWIYTPPIISQRSN